MSEQTVIIKEEDYARVIAERDEYRAKVAAYEATDFRGMANAALKLSAENSRLVQRVAELETDIRAVAVLLECADCNGKGCQACSDGQVCYVCKPA